MVMANGFQHSAWKVVAEGPLMRPLRAWGLGHAAGGERTPSIR